MTTFVLRSALCALVLSTGLLSVRAEAAPAITVRFADLNLNNPEGARRLYARIGNAAGQVCGLRTSVWDHRTLQHWKECYHATVEDAVRRVNQPALTAVHRQRTKVASG